MGRKKPAGGDSARAARAAMALGQQRLAGDPQAESPLRRHEVLLLLFFLFSSSSSFLFLPQSTADGRFLLKSTADGRNRPSTVEIDRQRPILAVPPGSGRSAYRSAVGPVCIVRYGQLVFFSSLLLYFTCVVLILLYFQLAFTDRRGSISFVYAGQFCVHIRTHDNCVAYTRMSEEEEEVEEDVVAVVEEDMEEVEAKEEELDSEVGEGEDVEAEEMVGEVMEEVRRRTRHTDRSTDLDKEEALM
ncbi:hypothetical protein GW17_00013282 [Ensete ventricosum]|nr:hypothetical protein GW17_00013282 [Ensete ventricosum]